MNAKWFDSEGKSSLGSDPKWSKLLRWQKSLIDYYGHNNLVKWNAGAGDEFSASHAFENGKLAMMIDGEWRVAFIGAEHPELKYGTAPMPVDDAQPSLYGSGYINGTIIGIPKSAEDKDASWAFVKYMTTNNHALAQFSNGIRNVPSTKSAAKSKELKPDANFATFTKIFANPKSQTTPITSAGSAYLDTFANFLAKWQAGRVSDLGAGLRDVDKQIDAKLEAVGRRRPVIPVGTAGAADVAPAFPATDRRRAKRRAAWRRRGLVLAFMSPWLVGFTVFIAYPLVYSAYLSLHSYDLLSPPRWVGLANYRYLIQDDPEIGTAIINTLWFIVVAVPLQVIFAFGIALMVTRAGPGSACSGRSSTSRHWRRRWRPRSGSSTCSTPPPARSTACSRRWVSTGRSGSTRRSGRNRPSPCSRCGGSGPSW